MRKKMFVFLVTICVVVLLGNSCDDEERKRNSTGVEKSPEDFIKVEETVKQVEESTKQAEQAIQQAVQPIVTPPPVVEPIKPKCNIQKDVKNEYCGVKVDVYQCKCAFHGEYCGEAGMSQDQAYEATMNGFNNWVAQLNAECEKNL